MIHLGADSRSRIVSKGITAGNLQYTYRWLVSVHPKAKNCRNYTQCDSLLIGESCRSHSVPYIEVTNNSSRVEHEVTTSKVDDDQTLFIADNAELMKKPLLFGCQWLLPNSTAVASDGICNGTQTAGSNITRGISWLILDNLCRINYLTVIHHLFFRIGNNSTQVYSLSGYMMKISNNE